jgi:enamine deaminase RidA (YjgF/YER057c/UK114 family)
VLLIRLSCEPCFLLKHISADLADMLEKKIVSGAITPEQFWKVVGLEKIHEKERKKKPVDSIVANALARASSARAAGFPSPASSPLKTKTSPVGYMPMRGPPYPYAYPPQGGMIGQHGHPFSPPAMHARQMFKYSLNTPPQVWNTQQSGYPAGILIGEPSPPTVNSPPKISGMFYSSGILPVDSDNDIVVGAGDVTKQIKHVFGRLDQLLNILECGITDILTMNIQVVDIHKNGKAVSTAENEYLMMGGKFKKAAVAMRLVGVSGLYLNEALVQLEAKIVVRKASMATLILER